MKETNKTKNGIKFIFQKELGPLNTLLDLGTKTGVSLFSCEDLGFRKFIGVDKGYDVNPDEMYFRYWEEKTKKTRQELLYLIRVFETKYEFYEIDYKDFPFEKQKYSAIICRFFLHFIPDKEKYILIERLYNSLEIGGLLYLRVNLDTNLKNTDSENATLIAERTYQGIKDKTDIRYLVDAKTFLENIKYYPELGKYRVIDSDSLTVVLIK